MLAGPDRRLSRGLAWIVTVLATSALVGVGLLWPNKRPDVSGFGFAAEVLSGQVTEVSEGPCSFAADLTCRLVTFKLLEGPDQGTITQEEWEVIPSAPVFGLRDKVLLNRIPEAPALQRYQFADRERRPVLLVSTLVFVAVVGLLARTRGLAAIAGLALSVGVLLVFIVPAILAGRPPELVALAGGGVIALLALYLAHGIRSLTHVAAIGTFVSLGLTVGLAAIVSNLARFSGLTSEETSFLVVLDTVNLRGLLLAGMVLGALGALDDVTVTQASAVWELAAANPELTASQLTTSAMRVGRDHVASSVNTLLLAYAGAAMPLLLLFGLSGQRLGIVANSEVVAVEVVRTLVGSIGLVAAVPVTTWLAARMVAYRNA